MRRSNQDFKERGYEIAAIGLGTPARAAKERADLRLPFPVLGDWDKRAYRAYGLGIAKWRDLIDPRLYGGGVRAVRSGSYFTKPEGDTRQLPGTFIIDPAGIVRYAKRAELASDIAATNGLLAWIDAHAGGEPAG